MARMDVTIVAQVDSSLVQDLFDEGLPFDEALYWAAFLSLKVDRDLVTVSYHRSRFATVGAANEANESGCALRTNGGILRPPH